MRGARVLNIDIGGGSTELSLMHDAAPLKLYSVGLGAIGLTERYVASDPVKAKELREQGRRPVPQFVVDLTAASDDRFSE